jgi:hypothetical protein
MTKFVILLLSSLITGCATQLTVEGQRVKLVTANQKEKCDSLDIITSSDNLGAGAGSMRRNALNKARNEVAELGGNAMMIISNSNDSNGLAAYGNGMYGSSTEAVVQVEALKCP